jgi:hypothetical protein
MTGRPRGSKNSRLPVGWRFRDVEVVADLGLHESAEIDKRSGRYRRYRALAVKHIPCGATRALWARWILRWVRQAQKHNGRSRPRPWCDCAPAVGADGYQREKNGRRLAHRAVMEARIGRALLPGETVHHVNGQRADNRPENLELWSSSHPRGQRVAEKLAWAHELIDIYEPAPADALTLVGAC